MTDKTIEEKILENRLTLDKALEAGVPKLKCFVYKITVGGKEYIGFTSQKPEKRMEQHLESAKNDSQQKIHQELRRFGYLHEFEVISEHENEVMGLVAEITNIQKYKPELNVSIGGERMVSENRTLIAQIKTLVPDEYSHLSHPNVAIYVNNSEAFIGNVSCVEWDDKFDEGHNYHMKNKLKSAGLISYTLTQVWNKQGKFRLGHYWSYKDEKSFVSCQKIINQIPRDDEDSASNNSILQADRGIVLLNVNNDD